MHQKIRAYLTQDLYPFHLPGHKRNPRFFLPELQKYDLTEIPGMDVLSEPTGILHTMQEKLADFYHVRQSFFLVNGASAGVVAAICATCGEGDALFAARNGHASMYNAMALSGAVPRYFYPQQRPDGLAGGVDPAVFDDMPQGAVAFVTSPTYEGFVSDIAAIARRVHARGGLLIVDEAHGAHFAFHEAFPQSATVCGADIVVQSLHKTLPVPGQCAVLHVCSDRVDTARLRFWLNAVQTTSPSYMLMAAADYALQILWDNPSLFDEYLTRLARFAVPDLAGAHGIFAVDPSKRLYRHPGTGQDIANAKMPIHAISDGNTLEEILAREYKLQAEMTRGQYVLLMTSVADTDEGFARLSRAVKELGLQPPAAIPDDTACNLRRAFDASNAASALSPPASTPALPPIPLPEIALSPRAAMQKPSQIIPTAQSTGRIAAELIAPCPPGIALIAPGERIHPNLSIPRENIRVLVE